MKNKITVEDIENVKVKLKPIFGIRPGIYLTIIYSIIILLVLFFLLVLPGIKNNGVRVKAETFPDGAVVYVDNVYLGTSPVVFFTKKGTRSFRIEKEYFKTLEFEENIGGRILGSLFFPKKFNIEKSMEMEDPKGFLKKRFKEISSYALIEDYYDRYQMPPLLSRTVKEFISGRGSEETDILYDFLYAMRVNLGSPEMVSEYIKAINIVEKSQDQINSDDISLIFDYFLKENNSKGLMLSILKAYPLDKRIEVLDSFKGIDGMSDDIGYIVKNLENTGFLEKPAFNRKSITFNDFKFIGFSSGTFLAGSDIPGDSENILKDDSLNSYPHKEYVNDFFIMDKEITGNDYSLFLNENPDWKIDNINDLISKNLVNKDYLAFQNLTDKASPISNISWYAAVAYCDWLETKLPASLSDFTVKLPSEEEWELAARLDVSPTANYVFNVRGALSALPTDFSRLGKTGLYDIVGNLWEWNDNWVFPGDSINGSFGLKDSMFEGVEKAVRGGSWANTGSEILVSTRGSQDPAWCTPFLGFRPVLVKK